jgi:hypothetical protein
MARQGVPYNAAHAHNQCRSGHVRSLQQAGSSILGVNSANAIDESSFGNHSRLAMDEIACFIIFGG